MKINLQDNVKGTLAQAQDEKSLLDDSLDTGIKVHMGQRSREVAKVGRRRGCDRLFHSSSWIDPTYTYTTEHYQVEVKEEVTSKSDGCSGQK